VPSDCVTKTETNTPRCGLVGTGPAHKIKQGRAQANGSKLRGADEKA